MMRAALSLTSKGYHAKPYLRWELEEKRGTRGIRIPAAYDKAMQALYAFALDPVAESTADKKSCAFRKGRSALDAHAYLCQMLDGPDAPQWIVRADVKSCYDAISHSWLLENIPMDRKVLREFLRAGVVSGGELFPTLRGISQGATLSPILGNMVLDGLQAYLYENLCPGPEGVIDYAAGDLVRFADDIIIAARSHDQAATILQLLTDFLAVRGLIPHPTKTYISNTDLGFTFLSRRYQHKDGILTVRPDPEAVKNFERELESFIMGFRGSQKTLILKLNKKLNGWAGYHRSCDAYDAFRRIDSVVQSLLVRKMRLLHPKRQWKSIVKRYWHRTGSGQHVFTLTTNSAVKVIRLASVNITTHKPVRVNFHPYLDEEYYVWLQSKRTIQKVSGDKHKTIWRRQNGRCAYCGEPMLADQELELVERVIGAGRRVQNLIYIHRRCLYSEPAEQEAVPVDDGPLDLIGMLEGVTDLTEALESPYWYLKEYFRLCDRSPVTLTFKEIEQMIGERLDWEAYFFDAFWFDETPGMAGELWEAEFPYHAIKPRERDYCISDACSVKGTAFSGSTESRRGLCSARRFTVCRA